LFFILFFNVSKLVFLSSKIKNKKIAAFFKVLQWYSRKELAILLLWSFSRYLVFSFQFLNGISSKRNTKKLNSKSAMFLPGTKNWLKNVSRISRITRILWLILINQSVRLKKNTDAQSSHSARCNRRYQGSSKMI